MTVVERAEGLLESSYDLSSCGIGVERQFTDYLAHRPGDIGDIDYLDRNVLMDGRSNLISSPSLWSEEHTCFDRETLRRLRKGLKELHAEERQLYDAFLNHHVTGSPFNGPVDYEWNGETAGEFLDMLYENGYMTDIKPSESDDIVSQFLRFGISIGVISEIIHSGGNIDIARIENARKAFIYGDGKESYLRFHTRKLHLMADIADEALKVWKRETGNNDYVLKPGEDGERWRSNWEKMFDEEMPPATELIRSARETADTVLAELDDTT